MRAISVKWNHQIVATRRAKAVVQTIQYDPEDDEQAPDPQTMNVQEVKPDDAAKAKEQEQPAEAPKTEQKDSKPKKK